MKQNEMLVYVYLPLIMRVYNRFIWDMYFLMLTKGGCQRSCSLPKRTINYAFLPRDAMRKHGTRYRPVSVRLSTGHVVVLYPNS